MLDDEPDEPLRDEHGREDDGLAVVMQCAFEGVGSKFRTHLAVVGVDFDRAAFAGAERLVEVLGDLNGGAEFFLRDAFGVVGGEGDDFEVGLFFEGLVDGGRIFAAPVSRGSYSAR